MNFRIIRKVDSRKMEVGRGETAKLVRLNKLIHGDGEWRFPISTTLKIMRSLRRLTPRKITLNYIIITSQSHRRSVAKYLHNLCHIIRLLVISW